MTQSNKSGRLDVIALNAVSNVVFTGSAWKGQCGPLGNKICREPAGHHSRKAYYTEARLNCDETQGASYRVVRAQMNVLMHVGCRPLAPQLYGYSSRLLGRCRDVVCKRF